MYICLLLSDGANIELKLYAISSNSPFGFTVFTFTDFIFTNQFLFLFYSQSSPISSNIYSDSFTDTTYFTRFNVY